MTQLSFDTVDNIKWHYINISEPYFFTNLNRDTWIYIYPNKKRKTLCDILIEWKKSVVTTRFRKKMKNVYIPNIKTAISELLTKLQNFMYQNSINTVFSNTAMLHQELTLYEDSERDVKKDIHIYNNNE